MSDLKRSDETVRPTTTDTEGTSADPTSRPGTSADPTSRPETSVDPTSRPETSVDPTSRPETSVDPTSRPETSVDPTSRPGTSADPTFPVTSVEEGVLDPTAKDFQKGTEKAPAKPKRNSPPPVDTNPKVDEPISVKNPEQFGVKPKTKPAAPETLGFVPIQSESLETNGRVSPIVISTKNIVESGVLSPRDKTPAEPRPASPPLSPGSMDLKQLCADFLDFKKSKMNEQKAMEQEMKLQFPKMHHMLKMLEKLSQKVTKIPNTVPDNEEQLRSENERLSYMIVGSASLFKQVDALLTPLKKNVRKFTKLTAETNNGIDERLKKIITSICVKADTDAAKTDVKGKAGTKAKTKTEATATTLDEAKADTTSTEAEAEADAKAKTAAATIMADAFQDVEKCFEGTFSEARRLSSTVEVLSERYREILEDTDDEGDTEERPVKPAGAKGDTEEGLMKPTGVKGDTEEGSLKPTGAKGDTEEGPVKPTGSEGGTEERPVKPAVAKGDTEEGPLKPTGGTEEGPLKPTGAKGGTEERPLKPTGAKGGTEKPPVKPTGAKGYTEEPPVKPTGAKGVTEEPPVKPTGAKGVTEEPPVKSTGAKGETEKPPVKPVKSDSEERPAKADSDKKTTESKR